MLSNAAFYIVSPGVTVPTALTLRGSRIAEKLRRCHRRTDDTNHRERHQCMQYVDSEEATPPVYGCRRS